MRSIIFFGSSPFSTIVLEKLIDRVSAVVTTPDKPVGRHLKLSPNPVKFFAQKHNIPVYTDIHDFLPVDIPPNSIALVAAHGRLLGPKTLSKFNNQVFVIHPSLLPKYRGPNPLQQQILDGITETGVTIIRADLGEDTGPIVSVEKDIIHPDDTWLTLGNRLFAKGTDLFFSSLDSSATPQDDKDATYTKKLSRQDGFLPWDKFIKFDYDRKFRAYYSWPGIWTVDPSKKRLKLVSLNPVLVQSEGHKPQPWPIQQLPKN